MNRALAFEIMDDVVRKVTKFSLWLGVIAIAWGCVGTKYLEKDQKLLYKQSIRSPRGFDREGMGDIFVQKANRRLFGLPINSLTWMYYWGLKNFNKETSWPIRSKNDFIRKKAKVEKKFDAKIAAATRQRKVSTLQFRKAQKIDALNQQIENGNNPMQWGEKVSVYDTSNVKATVDRLNNYLFNHGYFEGKTHTEISEYKKRISVVYVMVPGQPFVYDTLMYRGNDSIVMGLILKSLPVSKIRVGDRYDQRKLSDERDRIDLLLKDHGYYDFSKQYIDFQVDTTYGHKHSIALQMSIADPIMRNSHKTFTIDSITFTTDATLNKLDTMKRKVKDYKGIEYRYFVDQYSKKILNQRVFLHRDSLYSRTNTFATQRQLANLDIFKFVNINYDSSGGKFIANIFTSPLERYSWTNEAGVSVTQGYPGPYYSLSFKKRNIFHGLEIFELNGRFGFEGVAPVTQEQGIYQSTEANINGSVTFPQFLLPLGERSDRLGKFNPKTRLLAGFTYTDRPEYQRQNVTISDTYTWENKRTTLYSFTLVNLQIIQSTLTSDFEKLLKDLQAQGNNLINSFKPSIVSSMIFSMTWNPNNYGNADRSSYFMRVQAESGGAFSSLYDSTFATKRGLETYQYIRLGLDIRKKVVIDKNTSLAWRFNTGVAYAYGKNNSLPYEKYFFIGGSNSVRAWRPRRLGIGSSPPPVNADVAKNGYFDYRYERPGEILLEASVEWRKKLFGFVNGAFFIDAGNVWSFQQLPAAGTGLPEWADQGNTKFTLDNFYKEIAVGTGFGLRFDFSFLVLRLDLGIKAWDPSRKEGDRFVLGNFAFSGPYSLDREPVIWNIGIGYPF